MKTQIVLSLILASIPSLCAHGQKDSVEGKSYGIFQTREEYHAFMGGLKALKDPQINAMLPALNDIVLGNPVGHTARKHSLGANGIVDLLADKAVRSELEMVDYQYDEIKKLNDAIQNRISEQLRSIDLKNPKDLASSVRKITRSVEEAFEGVLLPHQLGRLRQLSMQNQMRRRSIVDVLTTDPLATKLKITDEQKKDLKRAEKEIEDELAREIAELRKKARKKLLSNLSRTQRNKLEEIVGDDFQFSNSSNARKFKRRKAISK